VSVANPGLLSGGWRFFAITAKPLPPWTSSQFPTVTFNVLYVLFIIIGH